MGYFKIDPSPDAILRLVCYYAIELRAFHFTQKGITSKMRVLIVDDTSRARKSIKALLEIWHPLEEVREAANGIEAVQLVEEFQPDFILMDARMPKMSGLEATRLIKAKWPQIKIIILSVFADYQVLALEAGADGFVSKSDPPEILRKILAEVLQNRNKNG